MIYQRHDEDTHCWLVRAFGWRIDVEWRWGDWCRFLHRLHPGFWFGFGPLYVMAFPVSRHALPGIRLPEFSEEELRFLQSTSGHDPKQTPTQERG